MSTSLVPSATPLAPLVPDADTAEPAVYIPGHGHYFWADSSVAELQAICPSVEVATLPLPLYPVRLRSEGTRVQVFGVLWQVLLRGGWQGSLEQLRHELFERGISAWHMGKRAQSSKGKRGGAQELAMRAKPAGEASVRLWLRAMTDELLVPIGYDGHVNGIIRDGAMAAAVIGNLRGRSSTLLRRVESLGTSLQKGGYVDLAARGAQDRWTSGKPELDRKAHAYAAQVPLTRSVDDRKDEAVAERLGIDVDTLRLRWKGPLRDAGFPICSGKGNWVATTDKHVLHQQRRNRRRAAHEDYNCDRFIAGARCWAPSPKDADGVRARRRLIATVHEPQGKDLLVQGWRWQEETTPETEAVLERALGEARDWVAAHRMLYVEAIQKLDRKLPLTDDDKAMREEYELAQELLTQERVTDAARNCDYLWAQGL
jgi:hypothetical protein